MACVFTVLAIDVGGSLLSICRRDVTHTRTHDTHTHTQSHAHTRTHDTHTRSLPFLDNCIKETLRLYPVASSIGE